jgi:HEPN domain-containing protein
MKRRETERWFMAHEVARAWLAAVDTDLKAARNCIDGPEPTIAAAAYHCQQAAEKLVKAALVSSGVHPRKTHDIGVLLDELGAHPLRAKFAPLARLTPFFWVFRYPGPTPSDIPAEPLREDVESWLGEIATARNELDAILDRAGSKD